jgi:hypothetical protein
MLLEELAGRLTCTLPEAGQLLGIGRDAAYAAGARGEIPTLRLGRRLVVPVPRLLELVGATTTDNEGASATDAPVVNTKDSGGPHGQFPTQLPRSA